VHARCASLAAGKAPLQAEAAMGKGGKQHYSTFLLGAVHCKISVLPYSRPHVSLSPDACPLRSRVSLAVRSSHE
jgi:hypothetical protein